MLKAMFNGGEEGKARMEGGGHDKEVASSKFNTSIQRLIPYLSPKWLQNGQNRYPIYVQNGWETLPFGAAHTYIVHLEEYPPPGGQRQRERHKRIGLTSRNNCCALAFCIHRMHKWRLNDYSFIWMLIRLTSLIFVWKFFCIFRMLTRLVRLISTKIKE